MTAVAESLSTIKERRPELFHAKTGYRIDRQRSPTPDDIPGPAKVVSTEQAFALLADGAIAVDVFGARYARYDELDGTWLVSKPRWSIPGAVWLPETGRGVLSEPLSRYLRDSLERITDGTRSKPIVVFCVADCWMSWNAAQRISKLGYTRVYWYRLGTDGWLESGRRLEAVYPVPVKVD